MATLTVRDSLVLLERELGGRSEIIQALATAPQSKDVRYILGLLADPQYAHKDLTDVCAQAKVMPGTLLELIERGTKLRARIIAGQIVAQHTPAMVRDVMQKAAPYEDDCTDCGGTGMKTADPTPACPNPTPEACPTCLGTKRLRFNADAECRKLGLEMAGLTAKGGGIVINNTNQQAQFTPGGGGQSFEVLQELMDRMMYGRLSAPIVDVTPLPPGDAVDDSR